MYHKQLQIHENPYPDFISDDEINFKLTEERNTEINQIETDMTLLSEIFTDLSAMIYTQGESIETAVNNVGSAEIHAHEATQNLEKAVITHQTINKKFLGALVTSIGVTATGVGVAFLSIPTGVVLVASGVVIGAVSIYIKVK